MTNETGEAVARRKRVGLGIAVALVLVLPIGMGVFTVAPPVRAQAPASRAADAAFQAVSVKPNQSGAIGVRIDAQQGSRFTASNAPLAILIRFAFDLPEFQLAGGPSWLDSDRFDVVAAADGAPTVDEKRMMLRRVLAERFGLAFHPETRDLPIYALVMARGDKRLGPGLHATMVNCAGSEGSALLPGLAGPPPGPGGGVPTCAFFGFSPRTNLPSGQGGLAFRGLTMGAFAKTLVTLVHRSVRDETGLSGYFDGDFDFVAELPPPPPPPGLPNPFTTPFTSVFTALPEQLGLKLDSRRGPVDVMVIDRAKQPTED